MKIILNSNNKDQNLEELISFIYRLKTKDEIATFLNGILTPKELEEISNRLLIVKMLKRRIPQQEIAKAIQVGVATVTRGAREIQRGNFKNV